MWQTNRRAQIQCKTQPALSPNTKRHSLIHASCCTMCLQAITALYLLSFLSYQGLHSLVSSVEKQAATTSGCPLVIHCKNFQVLQFVIPREQDCHDVHLSLQRLSQPGHLSYDISKRLIWWCFPADIGLSLICYFTATSVSVFDPWNIGIKSSIVQTLFFFLIKIVDNALQTYVPVCDLQRVTRSCIASPLSQTSMTRRDGRNGTSWTSNLSTAEWDSQTPCGNCPRSTSTTRSVSQHLKIGSMIYLNMDNLSCLVILFCYFQRWVTLTPLTCLYLIRPRHRSSWAAPNSEAEADFLLCRTTAKKIM